MKRISMHLTVFVVLLPSLLMFNVSGKWWINFLGVIYVAYLFIACNESERVRKFIRRYYHEVLRLENMM